MAHKCIFVTGSTGVGKTKLSLEIAKKLQTEIINMDAMQMNKPLNITLNKVTCDEMMDIKHHLLSFLEIYEGLTYDVYKFRDSAVKVAESVHNSSKIPVFVGGTTYYMEALIYEDFLSKSHMKTQKEFKTHAIHPNQLRKLRCDHNHLNIPKPTRLRYPNSLILWLDFEDRDQFKEVLSMRIDKMIENGLVNELEEFILSCAKIFDKLHIPNNLESEDICSLILEKDETNESQRRGILQCIGLKEFSDYLSLKPEEKNSKQGDKVFKECKKKLLTSTFQYAVRQKRWMINRFKRRELTGSLPIFRINVDEVIKTMITERNMLDYEQSVKNVWLEIVSSKVEKLVDAFIKCDKFDIFHHDLGYIKAEPLIGVSILSQEDLKLGSPPYTCHKCDSKKFYDLHSYKSHLKSKKHMKRKDPSLIFNKNKEIFS